MSPPPHVTQQVNMQLGEHQIDPKWLSKNITKNKKHADDIHSHPFANFVPNTQTIFSRIHAQLRNALQNKHELMSY